MDRPSTAADLLAGRRLGFACLVRGKPKLKSYDGRKWQNGPHLRVSIDLLREVFHYLDAIDVRLFRLSSQTAPYITHPTLPQFWHQIEECRDELADLGILARRYDLRLSMHPGQYTLLNAAAEAVYAASLRDLDYHAALLDALGLGPEHKVITHVGGVYGDKAAAMGRFVARYETLPAHVKARLVLESDETSYSLPDVLAIHAQIGIPIVWDWLHHDVNNPAAIPAAEATRLAVATQVGDGGEERVGHALVAQRPQALGRLELGGVGGQERQMDPVGHGQRRCRVPPRPVEQRRPAPLARPDCSAG